MLTIVGAALFGQVRPDGDVYRYLSIFSEVFSLVRSNYVEEVPPGQLVEGAFTGVTDAIDEFSYYVPPAQMAAYKDYNGDATAGVGLVMAKRYGYAYVIAPVAGSPASRAGIKAGDFIESVNGQQTQKLAIWEVEKLLQATDKPMKIGLIRGGETKRQEVTVPAEKYQPEAPKLSTHGSVAVITVPYFGAGAADTFRKQLAEVRSAGKKKLIVDVRGNAGGSYEEAIAIADELLTRGLITSVAGRRADQKKWNADAATGFDGEVKVLTDRSTAGGAEILAASIRDNQRGGIIGLQTYGRSIVQKLIPLPSGGALYMTVGHYTTPAAKPIKEDGLKPDQTVDMALNAISDEGKERDLILEEALETFGEKPVRIPAKVAA